VSATAILFVQEAIGGVVFGAVLGYGVFVMMRGIAQYQVEVMLTLALVIGGAALAARLKQLAGLLGCCSWSRKPSCRRAPRARSMRPRSRR
ncbi:hypothetical protein KQ738_16260, partial [Listeria monocytogenes]|nr:hypothetical protein [Listeria monocytogenes]